MKPTMSTLERARRRIDATKGSSEPPAGISRRYSVSQRTVAGFGVYSVVPRARRWTRVVVYVHGGSYIGEIAPQHWEFIARLVDAGVRVEVPVYGLAPEHAAVAAHDLIVEVYRDLLVEVEVAEKITVMGDSAGGGLALAVVQQLPALALPVPASLILISPWVDATLANPAIAAVEPHDPWLSSVGLREAGRVWAGELAPTDPRISPINGPMDSLPPVAIWCGTRDLLHPDVVVLARMIGDAGGRVHLTECDGAIHVYPVLPTPEGRAATRAIVEAVSTSGDDT